MDHYPIDNRDSVVKVITSPLGFFALSLLILEGFLAIIIIGSGNNLPPETKRLGMWMATSSFGSIVTIVSIMVIFFPKNLTFKSEDWMEQAKNEKTWGTDKKPVKYRELQDEEKEKPTYNPKSK